MATWQELVKTAGPAQTMERAAACKGKGTEYKLGKGGMDPAKPFPAQCDCTGFTAYAIGIPRELPPGSGRWLDTDAYWGGGGGAKKAAGHPLFTEVDKANAAVGDLLVYPDHDGKQGHIGIVVATNGNGSRQVLHCSSGNWKKHQEAVRETDSAVFDASPNTRVMRVDYAALKKYVGV